ncbi:MAG: tripartite tricarboxylate transporter substrate binding protein [Betaproteobacteria bacterium]|nr:tripartite tricarboxylate transporter substrate binding protein [Betaproteobacteria bacterium]
MKIQFGMTIRLLAAIGVAVGGMLPGAASQAQTFPSKPVHLIVPNAPGGAIDIMARLFEQHLRGIWTQPGVVEYKPGAGTALGTEYVGRSTPDGHTVGLVVTSHVINPSIRKLPFDTVKDFSGVTMTAVSEILISATPSFEANNIAELIALAKKRPGKLSYASPGSGSSMHFAGELLKQEARIDILHVPFKGSGPAYPEVMAGRIQLLIDPLFSSMPYINGGKLKPIAITGPKRAASAPAIPTVAETVPGFSVMSIFGVVVPSATPRDVVNKLNGDFVKVLRLPEVRKRMSELALEPVGNTPEQFDALIRSEIEKWAKVVKAAGIKND